MPTLPAVIVTLLLPFEHLFDRRTWRKAELLVVGAILSPGKRTVSSALSILGIGQNGDFAIFHQVLNRARWRPGCVQRAAGVWHRRDGGTTLGPKDCGQGEVPGPGAFHGRPGGDDSRTAMGQPDVADPHRVGRSPLGVAVPDRAGALEPL